MFGGGIGDGIKLGLLSAFTKVQVCEWDLYV